MGRGGARPAGAIVASVNPPVVVFSGGIIGGELHNRVDIQSYPNGAEIMRNFRPTLQGVMTRRPPLEHIDVFDDHAKRGKLFSFQFSLEASYLVLATEDSFRFFANDGEITLPAVTATLGSWIDQSTGAGSVTVVGAKVWIDSDGASNGVAEKAISIAQQDVVHVLAFEVVHGPIDIRIGSSSGDDDVLSYTRLRAGIHYLAFTPSDATVYLQFHHAANAGRVVRDTVAVLAGTDFLLPCPFAEDHLREVHRQQIRDVLYMVHNDYWPRRLERRGDRSWSIVKMLPDDGPFADMNTSDTTIAASGTRGEVTLTASADLFSANDEGVLYALTAGGQNKSAEASGADIYTDGIKVTGIGSTSRSFTIAISGTFVANVRLQRSSGNENDYANWQTYSSAQSVSVYDAQDNQTWYYRLAVPPGDYTSGTVTMQISYQGGSTTGVCRVIEYTSPTEVIAEVIEGQNFASTSAIRTWKRGSWNADDGFPSAISDGFARLWFGRDATVWASKSDDFTSFDAGTNDDQSFSSPLATPSSDGVRWLAMLGHLLIGTGALEKVGLSMTSSDPIGPTNWQTLPASDEGGSSVQPVTATGSVIYVHRSGKKLMQLTQNPKALNDTSYISVDLTARAPEVLDAAIVAIGVQREPERRIYAALESGRLCELLFRREGELDVVAWSDVETDGRVEDICVLPRVGEDVVYLITRRRNAAGTWERVVERFGPERPLMDCERYHLDAALGYTLDKPATVATPSGVTGTVTVVTDEDAFASGDVDKVLWINGGRGTIAGYVGATEITLTVTSELETADPCPSGRWGFAAATATLTGATHLAGQSVRVIGDMTDLGTYTVSGGGEIALSQAVSVAYAGKAFRSRWKSLKLSYGAQKGTALGMRKAIKGLILLLYKTGAQMTYGGGVGGGLKRSFGKQRAVPTRTPAVPMGEPVPLYTGEIDVAFDAHYDPDSRLCFEVDGPAPATVAGYVPILDEKDR